MRSIFVTQVDTGREGVSRWLNHVPSNHTLGTLAFLCLPLGVSLTEELSLGTNCMLGFAV